MDKEAFKDLTSHGQLDKAFARLLDHGKGQPDKDWYHAVLIQYDQFRQLEQGRQRGTLSAEDATLFRNRILEAVLSLIDDLPDGEAERSPSERTVRPKTKRPGLPWLLLGAIVILGCIVGYLQLNRAKPTQETVPSTASVAASKDSPAARQALRFPEGDEVTFLFSTGDEITYRILHGELTSLGGGAQRLSFLIRCSTRNGYGHNFWDSTFRLELDHTDVLLAPSSGLNELVANNSFKDGTVYFEVKSPFTDVNLVIINPWDEGDMRKLKVVVE